MKQTKPYLLTIVAIFLVISVGLLVITTYLYFNSASQTVAVSPNNIKSSSKGERDSLEKIYTATCVACHGAGVLGSPKIGDKALWAPRLAKGIDVLYANSINGINMMPARGGNAALKDDEMRAAVDYMVSKVN